MFLTNILKFHINSANDLQQIGCYLRSNKYNQMKTIFLLLFTGLVLSTYAQDFKPYKVKSGKITYENLEYSTVSGYSYKNGVETGYSKQVPYVAEQTIFYWDEFGDVAFEEIYQVSSFRGKLLPEKVKIAERLWVDEHRYYFDLEKNKVNDDPYYLRIECRERFQYYQIMDSWVETLYMGAEKSGIQDILGKQADYYNIDESDDLYVWKGLVLKDESFATTPKGERLYPHRTKIAVEVDTVSVVNPELFNPIWLKREKLYHSLDENKIVELFDGRQEVLKQADTMKGIELQKNDIVLFVTSKLTIGKMQILSIEEQQLYIKYHLYSYNEVLHWKDLFEIKNNTALNIDSPFVKNVVSEDLDFKWHITDKVRLFPQNNISVFLLKPSRSKTLEIPKFRRKN